MDELKATGKKLTPEQEKIYQTEGGYDPLDQRYTVFGEVVKGMEIVDKIANGGIYDTDKSVEKIKFTLSASK